MFTPMGSSMSQPALLHTHTSYLSLADLAKLGLLAAIWGGSFIAMRIAVPELGTLMSANLRILLAAPVLLLFASICRIELNWKHNYKAYFLSGLFGAALPFALLSYAANILPAALLALLNATCPLFGAIFSAMWLAEPINLRKLIGLVLGIVGVWLLAGSGAILKCSPTTLAISACLLSPACFALSGVIIKHHTCIYRTKKPLEPLAMATGAMSAACLILLPSLPFSIPTHLPSVNAVTAIIALALFPSAFAQLLFIPLIARIGPTRAMSVSFLIPLFSMLWGVIFLHETVGFSYILGGLVVLLATTLVIYPPQKPFTRSHPI
jgi:drug/metabolite transporter (DMT)-like permease